MSTDFILTELVAQLIVDVEDLQSTINTLMHEIAHLKRLVDELQGGHTP